MKKFSKHFFKKQLVTLYAFIFLLFGLTLTSCQNIFTLSPDQPSSSNIPDIAKETTSQLTVHYLDVGQADCILLQNQGQNVLIDAGNRADFFTIQSYLNKLNIKKLNTFVLTHPHEDHIGSASLIIQNYDIGTVYMTNKSSASKVYQSLLKELDRKKISPKVPHPGDNFFIGETAFTFLGPVAQYDDLNSMSLVLRADFGDNSFLFTGDSTNEAEKDMLQEKVPLEAQVLKVGHHGSRASSSYVFLKAVNPEFSVISTETGNDYGHPHKEILSRLNDIGSTLFRTDKSGTIIATSNGKEIIWNTAGVKSSKEHVTDENGLTQKDDKITYTRGFIGNRNSKTFHTHNCSSLPKKENQIRFATRKKALDAGYHPCGKCNP